MAKGPFLYFLHGCCISAPKGTRFQEWSPATGKRYRITDVHTDQSLPSPQQTSHDQMTYAMDTTIPWTLPGASHTLWCVYYLPCVPLPPSRNKKYLESWVIASSKNTRCDRVLLGGSMLEQRGGSSDLKTHICICLFQILPSKERNSLIFLFFKAYKSIIENGYSYFTVTNP